MKAVFMHAKLQHIYYYYTIIPTITKLADEYSTKFTLALNRFQ